MLAPVPVPVRGGLVAGLNRPGGNITGVAALTSELDPKPLEPLNEITPSKGPLGDLFNSDAEDGWPMARID